MERGLRGFLDAMLRLLLLGLLGLNAVQGGSILIYPFGHCLNSHLLNAERLAHILGADGHTVDFLISSTYRGFDHRQKGSEPFASVPGTNLVEFAGPDNYVPVCEYDTIDFMLYSPIKVRFHSLVETFGRYCDQLLSDVSLLQQLKTAHYDLFIIEAIDPCGRILADYLDIPFVPLFTAGLGHWDGNPRLPSYIPATIAPYTSQMTFAQRLGNLIMKVMYDTIPVVMGFDKAFEDLKRKHNINTSLSIADTFSRASIKLVNSDFAVDFPAPIEPDTVMVGGFAIKSPSPLPSELEEFIQSSGDAGVIVLSFGTLVKRFNKDWTTVFVQALSRLPQKVIWRYYGDTKTILNQTSGAQNIRIMKWLPQADLLAHPKTRLFITHCGLNAMFESVHFGVPVLAIPISGDQFHHAAKLVDYLQMGLKVNIYDLSPKILHDGVVKVLSNPVYKQNALAISSRLRDQPISAEEKIKFWIDYVIRHGGAKHLKSAAHTLTWFQYFSLDVIAVLGCGVLLLAVSLLWVTFKLAAMTFNRFVPHSVWKAKVH